MLTFEKLLPFVSSVNAAVLLQTKLDQLFLTWSLFTQIVDSNWLSISSTVSDPSRGRKTRISGQSRICQTVPVVDPGNKQ